MNNAKVLHFNPHALRIKVQYLVYRHEIFTFSSLFFCFNSNSIWQCRWVHKSWLGSEWCYDNACFASMLCCSCKTAPSSLYVSCHFLGNTEATQGEHLHYWRRQLRHQHLCSHKHSWHFSFAYKYVVKSPRLQKKDRNNAARLLLQILQLENVLHDQSNCCYAQMQKHTSI